MSTALGLAMQISANTAQLAQAVQDVNAKLDSMGAAGKKASDDLGTLKNIEIGKLALGGITAATTAFVSLSKSVVGAAQDVVNFGKSVADELDSLNDVANRTGVGVEALQAYGAAAKLSGTDVETFAKSIQKLSVNIGNATDEKSAKNFTALGIAFEELKAATPTEQFEMVADAIAKIQDPAERAAAAVKVFGKGGIELGPLFSEGPGALARMRDEATSLGQVVSEDSIKAIAAMNDAFDKVWMTVKGLTGQIVGELADPIATIAEDLLEVVQQVGASNIASTVAKGLLEFIGMAGNAFFTLAKFIEAFVKKFSSILGLDLQTPEQKARDKELSLLQGKQANAGFTGVALTEQELKRLKELQAQVAAEDANSLLNQMQQNFNAALQTATDSLAERTKPPAVPDPVVVQAAPTDANVEGQGEEQTRLLADIARNTSPPQAVELPR